MKIDSWLRIFSWPTYSSSMRGRSARSTTSSVDPAALALTSRLSSSLSIVMASLVSLDLGKELQRLANGLADGETFRQLLHDGDRFLVAVAQRDQRVEDVRHHRRRAT